MSIKLGLKRIGNELYYIEALNPNTYVMEKVKNIVYTKKSKYQLIEIIDTYNFGRSLVLDNTTQICEVDEHIYHEVFVHPAMICHPKPEKVLIIGGGDGGVLREVLKHPCVKRAVLVEIDEDVIKAVRKYMPYVPKGAFDDPRSEIVIEDGLKYVEQAAEKFDIIFMDLTDEIGPSIPLYTVEFYKKVRRILNNDGILITQALGIDHRPEALRKICSDLKSTFKIVDYYFIYIPSFTGRWAFALGSDKYNPMELSHEEVRKVFEERKIETKFYSPEIHLVIKIMKRKLDGRFKV